MTTHHTTTHDMAQTILVYERDVEAFLAKENIRDMTKDNRIQLTRAFAKAANQGGKHNAHFRRINLTPKGQVF